MEKKKKLIVVISVVIIAIIIGILIFVVINHKQNKNLDYEIEQITSWDYFTIIENGKTGVINKLGEVVIEPKYDSIQIPNPTKAVFVCKEDNKTKVLNESKEEIFKEYEEVTAIFLKELAIDIPYEKSVLIYKENGKYGIINYEGKKITDAIYEEIENLPYKEGELLIKKDNKYGVINILGKAVIEPKYNEIKVDSYYEEESAYRYSGYILGTQLENGIEYKYINYKGEELLTETFQNIERIIDIEDKNNIYLICEKNNKYGIYLNEKNLVANEYDSIQYDNLNKLFIVEKNNKYGILKIDGSTLISMDYDSIDIEGIYIYAEKDANQTVFNTNGEKKEDLKYKSEYITDNSEYKITIDLENKYGVVNNKGETVIPNDYYYIEYLKNNYFIVSSQNGKNGILDNNGNIVLDLKYDTIEKLENFNIIKATQIQENIVYLYNSKIEEIAKMKNAKVYENKDYIRIYSPNEQKYFNKNGEEKLNREILINNTLFAYVENGKWGFVDKEGNVKVECKYDDVTEFNEYGFAGINKNGKWGSINSKGEIVVEPVYNLESNNGEVEFIGEYYKFIYGYKKFYFTNNTKE